MTETSIRDVFLSMQLPPVDEIVATSKTDFRTIRKSRRSCYRSYHVPKGEDAIDTSNVLLDELINTMQTKNNHLKEHLNQENQAIEDLIYQKREIDLWRQLTNLIIFPSTRKKSIDDHLIAYDLNEKKTIEFQKDSNENAPLKAWNYIGRHITNDLIETILHESGNNNASNGHHAIKKARRTNCRNAPMLTDGQSIKKKNAVCKRLITVEETSTNIESIIQAGLRMSTNEFESFVQKTAPESYWHIMAEYYRMKLEEVTRENQQLHQIVDGLNTDNENLRAVADHCEYLTDIIEKLTNDEDNRNTKKASVRVRLF